MTCNPNLRLAIPDNKKLRRAAQLVCDIHALLTAARAAGNYRLFATNRGDSRDGIHRMRLFHDQFLLDAHKNRCSGTLYRSRRVVEAQEILIGPGAQKTLVHCEHAIPISILGLHIFTIPSITVEDLATLLFLNQFVCCVTVGERRKELAARRTYNGITRTWGHDHPGIVESRNPQRIEDVLVFARYVDTGIEVLRAPSGQEIDLNSYTVRDHLEYVGSISADTNCRLLEQLRLLSAASRCSVRPTER